MCACACEGRGEGGEGNERGGTTSQMNRDQTAKGVQSNTGTRTFSNPNNSFSTTGVPAPSNEGSVPGMGLKKAITTSSAVYVVPVFFTTTLYVLTSPADAKLTRAGVRDVRAAGGVGDQSSVKDVYEMPCPNG